MLTGKTLIDDIEKTELHYGEAAFWWLGQLSYILKIGRHVIYLDPFLSPGPRRLVPPLLLATEVINADIITGSHNHRDHIDQPLLPTMLASSPRCSLIIPRAVAPQLQTLNLPAERLVLLDDSESCRLYNDDIKITAVKAAHEFFDYDPDNGYPYLGYIIESNGVAVYHAGDTCLYEGLISQLQNWPLTLAFLPINGRDAARLKRGCIGNMTYQEAVDLAGSIKPAVTVPGHFEMFAGNTENPQLFIDYMAVKYPELTTLIPEHGTRYVVSRETGIRIK